jgi:predicted MFS family arabinose efflux permease
MKLNFVLAWLWILLGFGAGFAMGLCFHRENWLGGYASHRRRLYRLGHISFFGLAIINLLFYFTVQHLPMEGWLLKLASWGFAAGTISMPVCCVLMAHRPDWRALFLIPVSCLMSAGAITFWQVLHI